MQMDNRKAQSLVIRVSNPYRIMKYQTSSPLTVPITTGASARRRSPKNEVSKYTHDTTINSQSGDIGQIPSSPFSETSIYDQHNVNVDTENANNEGLYIQGSLNDADDESHETHSMIGYSFRSHMLSPILPNEPLDQRKTQGSSYDENNWLDEDKTRLIDMYSSVEYCEQCRSSNCSHMKMRRRLCINALMDRASQFASIPDYVRAVDDYHSILLIVASQMKLELNDTPSVEYQNSLRKISETVVFWTLHYCIHSKDTRSFQVTCELYIDIFPEKLDYLLEYTEKLIDGKNIYNRDVVVQCIKVLLEMAERFNENESLDIHSKVYNKFLNIIQENRSPREKDNKMSVISSEEIGYSKRLSVEHSEQLLEIHKNLANYEEALGTVNELIEKRPDELHYLIERADCFKHMYDSGDSKLRYLMKAREDCLRVMMNTGCDRDRTTVQQAESLLSELNEMINSCMAK